MGGGTRGVVASGHPLVSEAAGETLRAGGNAFDAVIAAGFAAAVAEPMFTSLGGGGFLLARTADDREILFDFFADTPGRGLPGGAREPHFLPMTVHFPASDQVFNIGLGSVAVPGTLRGLLHCHRQLGRVPIGEVVAPAIALARDGVVLNAHQAYVIELLVPINTLTEGGRALFAPGGRSPREGERIGNPDLAAAIESLVQSDARDFYEGEIAQRIAADMSEGQGLLTAEDLSAYRVVERAPLAFSYRGHRLLTNPPPSTGGSLIERSLSLLAAHDLAHSAWGSAPHLRALVDAMVAVERLRGGAGGTTHVSVSDANGNAASMSLSNGEGSGYVVPGTGIMLNTMLGEDDLHPEGFHAAPPGERVASMMSPTLVMAGDRIRLIVGSGGSKRIRTALLQVISNVVDLGMGAQEAVRAPRLHFDGELVQAEPGFDAAALAEAAGEHGVNAWEEQNLYFGGVHAVDPEAGGQGDPRRGGHAIGV